MNTKLILVGALSLSAFSVVTAKNFSFSNLGSSQILGMEAKCGDENKTQDAKCGEGKCGDAKTQEGKCGEKKCCKAKKAALLKKTATSKKAAKTN